MRILVIDDRFADVAATALIGLGHQVVTATSYEEGKARLEEGGVDLAMIDIHLPKGQASILEMRRLWLGILKAAEKTSYKDNFYSSFEIARAHSEEEPSGVLLAQKAKEQGVPYIHCTSEGHHAERLECVCVYLGWETPLYEGADGKHISHGYEHTEEVRMQPDYRKERVEYWLAAFQQACKQVLKLPA